MKEMYIFNICIEYIYHTHTHTMKYYSTVKKNEVLPFVTIWMNFEDKY